MDVRHKNYGTKRKMARSKITRMNTKKKRALCGVSAKNTKMLKIKEKKYYIFPAIFGRVVIIFSA